MRPFTSTISLEEARKRLTTAIRPVTRTERVALAEASGRVVSADVASSFDVPPFPRAAMDGYAVVAADTNSASRASPARLRIVEQIHAGRLPSTRVEPGACAEIATGGAVPDGADGVVMVEETARATDDQVQISSRAVVGQNITPRGADISTGDLVVRCGDFLNPSRLGAIAAVGCTEVEVYARPRVAVISTGNELVDPGRPLAGGQIYDVNRFTLASVVAANGGLPDPQRPAGETLAALTASLDACASADVIVCSGGSSVGERDLIVDLVAARGDLIFHGIAVKPGKPTVFALIGGVPFFGMPGNPTSCLSNAYVLLVPFLRATARLPMYGPRRVHARLGRRIVSPIGRHQFYSIRLADGVAFPAFKGSGDITSLSQADGYIEIPSEQGAIEEGALIEVTLF